METDRLESAIARPIARTVAIPTNAPPVMLTHATECAAVERLVRTIVADRPVTSEISGAIESTTIAPSRPINMHATACGY